MPELPEVEAFRSYIARNSLRKKIIDVAVKDKRLLKKVSLVSFKKALIGHQFTKAERQGKYVLLSLTQSDYRVVLHFGLNGSVDYQKDAQLAPKYAQVSFIFSNGSALFWIDKRKFGGVWWIADLSAIKGLSLLGKDALKITQKQFLQVLEDNNRKNIKALLMDQSIIAGIGNEYSDEILFQARIDPHHRAQDLTHAQRVLLYKKIKSVLKFAVKVRVKQMNNVKGEHTFSNDEVDGFPNTYLQTHRHTDRLCPKNKKHKLKKATIAGRSCYYCPIDQK
ncbi:MAG: Fpg/Nei family DNA glycosylase [Candidatus Babeliales bacterium]